MLPPAPDWMAHLVRMSGKSVTARTSMTPPCVVGLVAGQVTSDGLADLAARSVCAHHILGANDPFLAFVGPGCVAKGHLHRVVALAGDVEAVEFVAVVRCHACGGELAMNSAK